jgi:hypothetical protein
MANNYVLNAAADAFEQILILELKNKKQKNVNIGLENG